MKVSFFSFSLIILPFLLCGQIGIGTNTPNPSSLLDISSNSKGFLSPRLTTAERDSIVNPADGLIIFNKTSKNIEYYNANINQWMRVNNSNAISDTSVSDYLSVVFTTTNAYGFSVNNGLGAWTSQAITGGNTTGVRGHNIIVINTNTNAYGFCKNASGNGTWVTTPTSGTLMSIVAGKDVIVIATSTNAYAFFINSSGNGVWLSTNMPGSGTLSSLTAPNDMVTIKNATDAAIFYFDNVHNGNWKLQAIAGSLSSIINSN